MEQIKLKNEADRSEEKAMQIDNHFMELAYTQIGAADKNDGLPIGAILVWNNEIIGYGSNQAEKLADPTQHAEMQAIRNGIAVLREKATGDMPPKKAIKKFLKRATIYATMEPCPMCAGTIMMMRIRRVVISLNDPKWGALGSVGELENFPHTIQVDYSDHPDCCQLRDMPLRDPETKSFIWDLGKKNFLKHGSLK